MKIDILKFYAGEFPNTNKLYFNDIVNFDNTRLERSHVFIQWLFPLPQASKAVPGSPVLTDEEIAIFNKSDELKANLYYAFLVMLSFYGLEINKKIIKSVDYDTRANVWQYPHSHNYLRITRIIACLAILGLNNYSKMLYDCMIELYNEFPDDFTPDNKVYWDAAVKGQLIP